MVTGDTEVQDGTSPPDTETDCSVEVEVKVDVIVCRKISTCW